MKPQVKRQLKATLVAIRLWPTASIVWQAWQHREYRRWVRQEVTTSPNVITGPQFSLIVPMHRYHAQFILPLIASVQAQTYDNWELILVNASESTTERASIDRLQTLDSRIKIVQKNHNEHISANTNAGLQAAHGEFIALLDYDDTIAPFALAAMADRLSTNPAIDVFYSDEDKLSENGRSRSYAFFKPGYDEELIRTSNYICHFLTIRSSLLRTTGGLRVGYEGAQDYDLVLRLVSVGAQFEHIPRQLYHWRTTSDSTASVVMTAKPYVLAAARQALTDYVHRQQIEATVEAASAESATLRLRYTLPTSARILMVGGSASLKLPPAAKLKVTRVDKWDGVDVSAYDYVVAVSNPGVTAHDGDWLPELIARAAQPNTGLVAPAVVNSAGSAPLGYLTGTVGLELWVGRQVEPEFTYLGMSNWPRTFIAAAPLVVAGRSSHFEALASIDTDNLISRMIALTASGQANIFWPYAHLYGESGLPSSINLEVAQLPQNDSATNPNVALKNGQLHLH